LISHSLVGHTELQTISSNQKIVRQIVEDHLLDLHADRQLVSLLDFHVSHNTVCVLLQRLTSAWCLYLKKVFSFVLWLSPFLGFLFN
jgi:hypothetical protein